MLNWNRASICFALLVNVALCQEVATPSFALVGSEPSLSEFCLPASFNAAHEVTARAYFRKIGGRVVQDRVTVRWSASSSVIDIWDKRPPRTRTGWQTTFDSVYSVTAAKGQPPGSPPSFVLCGWCSNQGMMRVSRIELKSTGIAEHAVNSIVGGANEIWVAGSIVGDRFFALEVNSLCLVVFTDTDGDGTPDLRLASSAMLDPIESASLSAVHPVMGFSYPTLREPAGAIARVLLKNAFSVHQFAAVIGLPSGGFDFSIGDQRAKGGATAVRVMPPWYEGQTRLRVQGFPKTRFVLRAIDPMTGESTALTEGPMQIPVARELIVDLDVPLVAGTRLEVVPAVPGDQGASPVTVLPTDRVAFLFPPRLPQIEGGTLTIQTNMCPDDYQCRLELGGAHFYLGGRRIGNDEIQVKLPQGLSGMGKLVLQSAQGGPVLSNWIDIWIVRE